ncbi:MAG: Maf family protein [Robiginitomaculum sp.]
MHGIPKIVLASGSQIRRNLLRSAGLNFTVRIGSVDEAAIKTKHLSLGKSLEELPYTLALAKAKSVDRNELEIIIGADQIMEIDGQVFDKPKSMSEARTRLISMRGKTHRLIGNVTCIEKGQNPWAHSSETILKMRNFSDMFLDDYLNKEGEDILTSVGAYMFERRGVGLFEHVKGDFFSILGLSLLPLLAHLRVRRAILS